MEAGDPVASPPGPTGPTGGDALSRHTHKFVQRGEIWSLYFTMIGGAIFWGAFWAIAAWRLFKFNREALFFLGFLTTLSGLCLGITLYYRLRVTLARAEDRVVDRDLELG